jgi:hypothetical protein
MHKKLHPLPLPLSGPRAVTPFFNSLIIFCTGILVSFDP